MPPKQPQNQTYSAKNIQILSPREHIRHRPGMYVGGTDKRALHNLLWEVVDDIIAEATSGKSPCNQVAITLIEKHYNQNLRQRCWHPCSCTQYRTLNFRNSSDRNIRTRRYSRGKISAEVVV